MMASFYRTRYLLPRNAANNNQRRTISRCRPDLLVRVNQNAQHKTRTESLKCRNVARKSAAYAFSFFAAHDTHYLLLLACWHIRG